MKVSCTVKYCIASETSDGKLYDITGDVFHFLHGESELDIDYYITKQILPALDRFLGVIKSLDVKPDVKSIYENIRKFSIQGSNESNPFHDSEDLFFCLYCGEPHENESEIAVCVNCLTRETIADVKGFTELSEAKLLKEIQKCRKCQTKTFKMAKYTPNCINLDCGTLYSINYLVYGRKAYLKKKLYDTETFAENELFAENEPFAKNEAEENTIEGCTITNI